MEQECGALSVESGNGWLQQIRTRFLNRARMVVDREVVVVPWGPLRFSLAALPWGRVGPFLHQAGEREWACGPACWLPSIFVWSIFCPDDREQPVGPACCPRPRVVEKVLNNCCFLPTHLPEAGAEHLHQGPRDSFRVSELLLSAPRLWMMRKMPAVLGRHRDGLGPW